MFCWRCLMTMYICIVSARWLAGWSLELGSLVRVSVSMEGPVHVLWSPPTGAAHFSRVHASLQRVHELGPGNSIRFLFHKTKCQTEGWESQSPARHGRQQRFIALSRVLDILTL